MVCFKTSVKRLASAVCLVGLLSTSLTADSQGKKQTGERPKIGLVLSGGGAKGAAHIGVLEQLEAMNVQVDCIAGTSFGAIVGGLYASGVSPAEMKKSLQEIDWDTVLSNSIPRQQQTFRRKQDTDSFLIPYQLGVVDGKVVNPPAFIDNANLSQVIRGLLKSSHGNIDFDHLPIPFRAVATDFSNGSEVVLGDGNLADAIVASMSVPSLFPVFELNGKLLVDGGIANNVPVSVARNMCADQVIVVNLAVDPEKDAHENRGITGALKQISSLLTYQNARIQLASINEENGDIIITPDMEGFSFTDFKKTLEIAAVGREAAKQVESKLAAYSVGDSRWSAFVEAREAKTQHTDPYIREIQITNDSPLATAKLEAFLGITAGDTLDKEKLEKGLSQLYGLGYFDRIKYTIDEHELGGSKLSFDAKYREWARDTLRFGVAFDDNFDGESSVQLSLQHTRNGLNGLGGEWRNEVEIGSNQRLQTQLYQPLDYKEKHFLQATARFQRTGVPFRDEDGIIALELGANVLDFSLSAGRNFGQWGSLSVGAAYSLIDIERRSGLITDPQLQAIIDSNIVDDLGVFANFRIDTLDSLTFPRKGMILNANYIVDVGQGDAFSNGSLQLEFAAAKSWGRNTLAFFSEFGTNFSDNEEFQNVFQLGGFRSLSGFSRNELAGSHITQAGLTFYRRMGDDSKVLFDSPLYLGFSTEIGNVWADLDDFRTDDLILGGTLFAGVESPIGPIFLGGGHNSVGRTSFFLFIGGIF